MYDLSNTIFCPIGSALKKHPVVSQDWTNNSKRLNQVPLQSVQIQDLNMQLSAFKLQLPTMH